ncbi:uncharacterized protein METZ01_LOCUS339104 [marine metagenome]|uniref:Uncharacterized protein n=1 Tax=marine metagenome TaxID=408172 RepID=A0A382QMY7_9ZZZZ
MKRLLLLIVILFCCTKHKQEFQLTDRTYNMWQEFIKPTSEELAWAQIPWRSNFYDGLVDSDHQQKPLLLWVMNGHPLGCT